MKAKETKINNFSTKEYLDIIRPYLSDYKMINDR